jgi:hypothetical protein
MRCVRAGVCAIAPVTVGATLRASRLYVLEERCCEHSVYVQVSAFRLACIERHYPIKQVPTETTSSGDRGSCVYCVTAGMCSGLRMRFFLFEEEIAADRIANTASSGNPDDDMTRLSGATLQKK